jgi:hypothetical protein
MKEIKFEYNPQSMHDMYEAFQSHPVIRSLYPANPAVCVFFEWMGIFNRAIVLSAFSIKEQLKISLHE